MPQNRERVFVISILGEHEEYEFPKAIPLDKCIKDILEDEVDDKYYLSDEIQKRFKVTNQNENIIGTTKPEFRTIGQRDLVYNEKGIMGSLVATDYKQPKQIAEINQDICYVGKIEKIICEQRSDEGLRFFKDNICGTIRTINSGGDKRVIELPCIAASRGRNPENPSSRVAGEPTEQRLEFNTKGISNTLTRVQKDNYVVEQTYRIRKLTPRECFRLMGLKDDDIDKIKDVGISNSQQYKLAGNSIVVDVLEAIFKNLFL